MSYPSSYDGLPDVTDGQLIAADHENAQSSAINHIEAVLTLNPPKAPVRLATTGALSASFASDILTASGSGVLSIDGVGPSVGDRVLVKDETGANELRNGIYVVTNIGSASSSWVLTRSDDLHLSHQAAGAVVFVSEGLVNARTQWASRADASFVLDTSGLEFSVLADLVPKAPLVSPALTGTPTAPTASPGTGSTQIATTAYVDAGLATRAPSSGIAQSAVTNLVTDLAGKVPTSTTINSHPLSANVNLVKADVGLGNVDNTSDANKPVSTATQAALDSVSALSPPAGTVLPYAGASAPTGWLLCDGSAVSRTTYSTLFAVIGTTFGAGNGSTTFNLPDTRGRSLLGAGTGSGLTARALGSTGGEETHLLATSEMPAHSHTDNGHQHGVGTYAVSAHTHPAPNNDYFGVYTTRGVGNAVFPNPGTNFYNTWNVTGPATPTLSGSSQSGSANLGNTGGGGSHNVMHPYLALNHMIKT